jgi:hypothetical protein
LHFIVKPFTSCTFASKDSTIGQYFNYVNNRLVNSIHSSSLAAHQTGYIRPARDSLNQTQAKNEATVSVKHTENIAEIQASTPEQIQNALTKTGLNRPGSFFEHNTPRSNKALQAYAQTSEQLNQTQLENIISHVDYYA